MGDIYSSKYYHTTKILTATPTFMGGSFVCIEELLNQYIKTRNAKVLALGLGQAKNYANFKVSHLPYFNFDKLNPAIGRNIFFNFAYQLPLQFVVLFQTFLYRPNLVVSNGFTPLLLSIWFLKLFRIPVVIYYGTYLKEWLSNNYLRTLIRILNKFTSLVFVNSVGSFEDASQIVDESKIHVISHVTDFVPVYDDERNRLRELYKVKGKEKLMVFANRLIPEKNFDILLEIISKLEDVKNLKIIIAGEGMMKEKMLEVIKGKDYVSYVGFLSGRQDVRNFLASADVSFASATQDYLEKPAIESMAVGTPVIIPDLVAVREKRHAGVRVPHDIIPDNVGFIIDHKDKGGIKNLIAKITATTILSDMRDNCVKYVQKHHSMKNLDAAVQILDKLARR